MFTGESGSLHIELLSSGFDKHAHIFLIYTCTIALLRSTFRPCLDHLQKLEFFHSLSITSIFERMHAILNVGKKIINCTV
jgi:hypothetical protein